MVKYPTVFIKLPLSLYRAFRVLFTNTKLSTPECKMWISKSKIINRKFKLLIGLKSIYCQIYFMNIQESQNR